MNFFFFNSAAYAPWSFETPDTIGIGNSETAQVEMTRGLAARGHEVKSFCLLDGPTRRDNGVDWLHVDEADWCRDKPGIWVVSRSPAFLDKLPPRPGRKVWFVCQDVEYGDHLTPERLAHVDRLFALCQTHAEYLAARYPLAKNKIVLSSNAARVDAIAQMPPQVQARNPFKIAHTSSPDRGLIPTLAVFKRAREFEPRLELVVCYGFENLERDADSVRKRYIADIKKQLDQPGVINMGKLPQPELYKLLLGCGMWLYPTNFTETGCVNHLEAMCCGAVPVFSPLWALEANGGHGWAIAGDADSTMTRCRFARAVVRLAWDPSLQERIRLEMIPWARRQFSWDNVVDHYEAMACS